ncbi:hypothetical protein Ciccas_010944 [Cichlidogyrus casuarinus]|uniref:MULE transposase domain-containing protein n=1 Tax=Cichlidogyrus casuarinus TaxID=1844966 RepID=A0ABD2PTA9_9PLAT
MRQTNNWKALHKQTPGNFHVAPTNATIGDVGRKAFTGAYCFLPAKTQDIYRTLFSILFREIRARQLNNNVIRLSIDFEVGAKNGFSSTTQVFNQPVDVHYCYFHLAQNLWKKTQPLLKFNHNNQVLNFIALIKGLAFIPLPNLNEAVAAVNARCAPPCQGLW